MSNNELILLLTWESEMTDLLMSDESWLDLKSFRDIKFGGNIYYLQKKGLYFVSCEVKRSKFLL